MFFQGGSKGLVVSKDFDVVWDTVPEFWKEEEGKSLNLIGSCRWDEEVIVITEMVMVLGFFLMSSVKVSCPSIK